MKSQSSQCEARAADARTSGAKSARAFSERVAVVTGASGAIGRAISCALAENGLAMGLLGRDAARLADTASQARRVGARETFAVTFDFSVPESRADLVADMDERLGGVDILIHSSGAYSRAPTENAPIKDFDVLYATNLRGPYELIQCFLPMLRRRQGDIVLINSTQGLVAGAQVGQYAATQHALRAVADSLREEVNGDGVRVALLHAGSTATPLQSKIRASIGRPYTPEKLLQPRDIASMVVATLRLPHTAEVTSLTIRPTWKP